jgi:hypothetical protein
MLKAVRGLTLSPNALVSEVGFRIGQAGDRDLESVPKHSADVPFSILVTLASIVVFSTPAMPLYKNVPWNEERPHEAFIQW